MTNAWKWLSRLIGFQVLLVLLGAASFASAQVDEQRIVYGHHDGNIHKITFLTQTQMTFVVPEGDCFRISPDLTKIVLYNPTNQDKLQFYDLLSNALLFEIDWESDWVAPCRIDWINNHAIQIYRGDSVPTDERFDQLDIETGSITGPKDYYYLNLLPGLYPQNPIILPSPSYDKYIYEKCFGEISSFQGIGDLECKGHSDITVYNLDRGEDLAYLSDASARFLLHPRNPADFYSWSPSGRYIAYLSGGYTDISIYDLSENKNIDLGFMKSYPNYTFWMTYGIQWSADETKVMGWLWYSSRTNPEDHAGMALIDLKNQSFQVIDVTRERIPRGYVLESDGQTVLIMRDDKLVRMGMEGSETVIAENIDYILSAYPSLGDATTPTLLPSITDTPTETLRSIFNPPSCAVSCWLGIKPGMTDLESPAGG